MIDPSSPIDRVADPMTVYQATGLVAALGIEILIAGPDRVEGRMTVAEQHLQPTGLVHGGTYSALVETLASIGADEWAVQQGMTTSVGVSNTTDFLRPTRDGTLLGTATPIHRGRTQQLWQVIVRNDQDTAPVAHGQVRLHNLR